MGSWSVLTSSISVEIISKLNSKPYDYLGCVPLGWSVYGSVIQFGIWIMVHQRNWWIHDQSGFTGSFDVHDPDMTDLGSLIRIQITLKESSLTLSGWKIYLLGPHIPISSIAHLREYPRGGPVHPLLNLNQSLSFFSNLVPRVSSFLWREGPGGETDPFHDGFTWCRGA